MTAGRVRVEADAVTVLVTKFEMKFVTVEAESVVVTTGRVMVFVDAG